MWSADRCASRRTLLKRALCFAGFAGLLLAVRVPIALADTAVAPEVTRAEKLYNDGEYRQAIDLLNVYLSTHPNDATALVDRGDDYEALDNQQAAIADYTAAIAINPEYAYAYASRCESYFELDQGQRAMDDCDKAIELNPKLAYAIASGRC